MKYKLMGRPTFTCRLPGGAILHTYPCQLRHCVCNLEKSYICMMCNCLSFIKKIFVPLQSSIPVPTRGSFVGFSLHTKLQSPPRNNKHYKSAVFVKILDVKPPCTNLKTLIEDFLTTVLQSSMKDRKK